MSVAAGQHMRASDFPQANTCAEFQVSANQTISTSTDTTLAYDTINSASSLVTQNSDSPGHSFTLNKAGLWAIFADEAFNAQATGGRVFYMTVNGVRFANVKGAGSSAADSIWTFGKVRPFNNGDVIRVRAFQDSGSNATRAANLFFNYGQINFCWLGG